MTTDFQLEIDPADLDELYAEVNAVNTKPTALAQLTKSRADFLTKPRAGVQFIKVVEPDEIAEGSAAPPRPKTIKAVVEAYHAKINIYGPEHVIVVCPFKDKPSGVKELNDAIRASLGYGPEPRVGDFLMIMKNSFDRSRLNGERYRAVVVNIDRSPIGSLQGIIEARLIGTSHEVTLAIKPHDKGPCKDVDWGYVATVHKYQGSEAAAAIVVIPSGTLKLMQAVGETEAAFTARAKAAREAGLPEPLRRGGEREPWFCDRSFVYTACSRPKLSLVLIGDPDDICGAIALNRSDRVTALSRMFAAEGRAA